VKTSSLSFEPSVEATPSPGGAGCAWTRFWFQPADPVGLHIVRLFAGVLFLSWLLAFAGHQEEFFGLGGWFDRLAYRDAARLPDGAPVPTGWSILHLCGTNPAAVQTAYWLSVTMLLLFTVGVATRLTAVLTWVIVASFIGNPAISYGPDCLLAIVAFYLMIGYVLLGQWSRPQTLGSRLLGGRDSGLFRSWGELPHSIAANLVLRLLQVHFAVVVVVSGLHKLQFGDWWGGVAFWYPLHPPLETTADTIRSLSGQATSYLFGLSLAQYVLLSWQIGFPLFAWRRGWRPILLGGAALGWAGSLLLFKEPLFGAVLFLASLSYVTSEEWRAVFGRVGRLFHKPAPVRRTVVQPERPAPVAART
jgi:hypothetical protein